MTQLTVDIAPQNCTEIRTIREIMPEVLDRYGLLEGEPGVEAESAGAGLVPSV